MRLLWTGFVCLWDICDVLLVFSRVRDGVADELRRVVPGINIYDTLLIEP